MRETPLNAFLIACGRAPENPIPPRWPRVLRRWQSKHPATVFSATDRALVQILARLVADLTRGQTVYDAGREAGQADGEPGSEAQETKR